MSAELYAIAQNVVGGGSGKGNSYWEVAANCGNQRFLQDSLGKRERDPAEPLPDWAVRGTYLHLLMQWWQEGRIPAGQALELQPTDTDAYWHEALTLFSWFAETYPKDLWGRCVGTEVQVPGDADAQTKIAAFFGLPFEWCPTGRYDMRTEMDDAQVERAASWGVLLPGPGPYIADWKHGKQHNADDEKKYTLGVQPILYLTLDRILNPRNPARGMIFHKVSMTKEKGVLKKKDTSFRTYIATWQPWMLDYSRSMIRFAYEQMLARTKNGYACPECPFFQKECAGY